MFPTRKERRNAAAPKPETGIFNHTQMGDELWDERYEGASAGYLDGSSDVRELERRDRQSARTRSLTRTDTASERVIAAPAAGFQDLSAYLMAMVEARAQELAMTRSHLNPSFEEESGEDKV